MALRRSKIGYVDYSGADLNFIIGCTKISPGCANCYAERLIRDRQGKDFSQVRLYPEKLKRLVKAKFKPPPPDYFYGGHFKRGPGSRPLCFPIDLGDIFHSDVPDWFLWKAFLVFDHFRYEADFLILTKRPGRMHLFQMKCLPDGYPPNCWMGVSVENQARAVRRISILLSTKCSMRWVSLEPMLEPINLQRLSSVLLIQDALRGLVTSRDGSWGVRSTPKLDWVVLGAESGPRRREFNPGWADAVYKDCQQTGVAFFGKQDSGLYPGALLLIQGKEIKEFPNVEPVDECNRSDVQPK